VTTRRRQLRVVIAPQEFKGTLTAAQATEALARGLRAVRPAWQLTPFPLADGGPGTLDLVLARVPGARRRTSRVADPLGRPVDAAWAVLPGDVAVIEMAQASGLGRVATGERRPLDASTFGTGQLIRAALDAGCRRLIVGAGGSATTDGGAGALAALGARFLDDDDAPLRPTPRELARCASIELDVDHRLSHAELEVWTDVRNPMLGPDGASHVYARQKGATGWDAVFLEQALRRVASLVPAGNGLALARLPGSGAAGGLAWGLVAACGATLQPGFLSLAALVHLDDALARADLVLTGEGRLDAQTKFDKGPWGLARLAKARRCRVVCFAGACTLERDAWRVRFDEVVSLGPPGADAARRLEACARTWAERGPG
jgi:glycerate kinase